MTHAKAVEDTKSRRKEKYLMIGAACVASPLLITIFSPLEVVAGKYSSSFQISSNTSDK